MSGRRKSVAQLEKQLIYAQKRAAHTPAVKEATGEAKSRKSSPRQYRALTIPGTEVHHFTVRASIAAMEFFGDVTGAELGLGQPAGDVGPPRYFKTAKIHGLKAGSTGTRKEATVSGRPYVRYTQAGGQSSFSSPISSPEGMTGVITLVKSIYTAKQEVIGPYGRIYYSPEIFTISG